MDQIDLFGSPLKIDPTVALPSLSPRNLEKVPSSRTSFLVELVGTQPIPPKFADALLEDINHKAIGTPQVYGVRPGDQSWSKLIPGSNVAYDALQFAWKFLGERGNLTAHSATALLQRVDQVATAVGRNAISQTDPSQVPEIVSALLQVRDQLDTGVIVTISKPGLQLFESEIWVQASRLGLVFSPVGSFDWVVPMHPSPVWSLTPLSDVDSFSLAQVQRQKTHEGLQLGFRLATCPAADVALDGLFRCADFLARTFQGQIYNENDQPLELDDRAEISFNLNAVIKLLSRAGLAPGSYDALALFAPELL